jgi:hypothetical protein
MATQKKEYSAPDAEPVVLYGLTDPSSNKAIPVICTTSGYLTIVVG